VVGAPHKVDRPAHARRPVPQHARPVRELGPRQQPMRAVAAVDLWRRSAGSRPSAGRPGVAQAGGRRTRQNPKAGVAVAATIGSRRTASPGAGPCCSRSFCANSCSRSSAATWRGRLAHQEPRCSARREGLARPPALRRARAAAPASAPAARPPAGPRPAAGTPPPSAYPARARRSPHPPGE
jgi:hypothetical protein